MTKKTCIHTGTYIHIDKLYELGFSLTLCPTSGEQLCREYTKFDFTVDEEKGRLRPSRDKKSRQAPQKEGKILVWPSSWVPPAGASTYYTEKCSLPSRMNGMTTHNTHTCIGLQDVLRDRINSGRTSGGGYRTPSVQIFFVHVLATPP